MPEDHIHRNEEPAYAGISTFAKLPLVLDPADLAGVDVAILGAPSDELVSYRPGARFGPRAIRAADPIGWTPVSMPNMDVGLDPFEALSVVDHGDVPPVAGYPLQTHDRIRQAWPPCAPPARSRSSWAATTRSRTPTRERSRPMSRRRRWG